MPSVNAEFFGHLLKALIKCFGSRMSSQQAYNDLIYAAGELERAYLACPENPVTASAADPDEAEVCPECGQEVDS